MSILSLTTNQSLETYDIENPEEKSLLKCPLISLSFRKGLLLVMPEDKHSTNQIVSFNLTLSDKEKLFGTLDKQLHLKTSVELLDYIDTLEDKLDLLEDFNYGLKERISWLEHMLQDESQEEEEYDFSDL